MRKKVLNIVLVYLLMCFITGCGSNKEAERVPENVSIVQHKIDKALESEPTYKDIVEIKDLYDDLLYSEQELVKGYDKIEEMLQISSKDVACIFAIQTLKGNLKAPNSLEISAVNYMTYKNNNDEDRIGIQIEYSAQNSFGTNIADTYYCLETIPVYDEQSSTWLCDLDELFRAKSIYEEKYSGTVGSSSQSCAKSEFETAENVESMEIDKIIKNIDLKITDLYDERIKEIYGN